MVVAVSRTPAVTRPTDPPSRLSRRPLTPSDRQDNAAFPRNPRTKPIPSRYLTPQSSSSSSTTSTSYSPSSSPSPSFSSRRIPSGNRPSTPSGIRPSTPPALAPRRSQSADRIRPSTPRRDPEPARVSCTTTRSLSVSFQGESFFYQTSKSPCRKPSPDRRRPAAGSADHHHRWPAVSGRKPSVLAKSLDCSAESDPDLISSVQLLRRSFDEKSSPRSVCSPVKAAARPSSPGKIGGSPSRGVASPLRGRGGGSPSGGINAPSIISFAAEVRRSKKGENRIEEAHVLRLLHNQHLQWRCVNARVDSVMRIQRVTAEVSDL